MTAVVEIEAGVVHDLDEQTYHRHPSLSVSGAKKLLPPSAPAIFRYEQDHPRPPTDAMELGTAAHKLVLGVGCDLVEIEAENWRTNAAKDAAKDAREQGAIPLLSEDMRRVEQMALALREHPIASALLNVPGTPEASLFCPDPETGVLLRGRLDFLPDTDARDRLIVADYKTCAAAHPDKFSKDVANYGYHQQAAWYLDLIIGLGLADDPAFLFIAQEKQPPYLVTVAELDAESLAVGRAKNRTAIDIYATCTAADHWPGYADDVALISIPRWAA